MKETYQGSCHCGAVSFTFRSPEITDAMRCDCSICARKGIVLSNDLIVREDISIVAEEGAQQTYQFGTMTARHHFCGTCGIHVFVETRLNPGQYRVNLGCVDELDALRLPAEIYDGKNL